RNKPVRSIGLRVSFRSSWPHREEEAVGHRNIPLIPVDASGYKPTTVARVQPDLSREVIVQSSFSHLRVICRKQIAGHRSKSPELLNSHNGFQSSQLGRIHRRVHESESTFGPVALSCRRMRIFGADLDGRVARPPPKVSTSCVVMLVLKKTLI